MNETRRIALEFAVRLGPKNSRDLIRVAILIEAFLTDNDEFLFHALGLNDQGEAEDEEARP